MQRIPSIKPSLNIIYPYLCNETVRPLETGLDSLRRLGGELDGALQQVDGELGVHLRGDPAPETIVHRLRVRNLGKAEIL